VVTFEGLRAGYWQEGDLTYALVGPETDQELVAIATQLGAGQPRSPLSNSIRRLVRA
jgi:hypothetical protein